MPTFDDLLDESLATPFQGWDFSRIEGRVVREGMPWDYTGRVNELAARADSLVDLGTGGGEFVADITPHSRLTVATEGWRPNVPVAAERLRPIGLHVVAYDGAPDNAEQNASTEQNLPFRDGSFDIVIDRHEAFFAPDVARILKPGGTFLTQQVGGRDCIELCDALGGVTPQRAPSLEQYVDQLTSAGFDVRDARECHPAKTFMDSGALLYYLRAIPWAFVGFSFDTHRERLREIHDRAPFTCHEHRLYLEAVKP